MGLSIHYKGRITNPDWIRKLYQDLIRLAHESGWRCHDLTSQKKTNTVELILELHTKCDPVFFLFDSSGRLHAPSVEENETREIGWCSVKTQYAPIETHIALISLLRYIAENYISDLEVIDEGGYWKTNDVIALQSARDFLNEKTKSVIDSLTEIQEYSDMQDAESLADLVEEAVKKRLESEKRRLN